VHQFIAPLAQLNERYRVFISFHSVDGLVFAEEDLHLYARGLYACGYALPVLDFRLDAAQLGMLFDLLVEFDKKEDTRAVSNIREKGMRVP